MNKREKLKILKAMYKQVQRQTPPFGLCEAYSYVTEQYHVNDSHLTDLGISKPRKKYTKDWWWDWNDRTVRLSAITRALKKLISKARSHEI